MKFIIRNIKIILAFLLTIFTALLDMGMSSEKDNTYYGFPARILSVYGYEEGLFSFEIWGLLFNLAFFYLLIMFTVKLLRSTPKRKMDED
ncbi:hypothetical protein [Guptibacillus algicola]|uniref:hypothetical protein n=1 Tax=Guptibacillus algicola TaxID=225844 RepID=UPI001CD65F78|nr:hypothetical protein [Alkalihalobacillus algicola]MCA0985713.1 hypothetical protein [Alkalihalobacillus algicola]